MLHKNMIAGYILSHKVCSVFVYIIVCIIVLYNYVTVVVGNHLFSFLISQYDYNSFYWLRLIMRKGVVDIAWTTHTMIITIYSDQSG